MSAESPNLKLAPCPACGDTGWEFVEGKGVRPCDCKRIGRTDLLEANARIPRRFAHCALDNFEPLMPSLHRAMMNTRKFVEEYPVVDVGLLYLGRCGVGKTHLAVAALKELIKKGIPGIFYDFRDLLKEIQDSYNPNTHTSELKILTPIFDAEVLVLDELGSSKPTEWVQETITHIINKRYNDRKITLFTSNYLDIPIGSAYDESLTERVGVRLRSRLHEMCRLVLMEGDDYRETLKTRRGSRFSS
ncbi:MAG TPA: ATP-binding protein [Blastocatellia bacterium]|nr:ATP-binding protein [Blastocatellia bacterium]